MNRIQKMAWMTIICTGTGFIFSAIAVTFLYFRQGFPQAWAGLMFMACAGFAGFAPIIFKKDTPAIVDERDLAIKVLAKSNGSLASFVFFILLAMGIWMYHGPDTLINVNILPICVCLIGIIFALIESLTYIIEYSKDNKISEGGAA